MNTSTDRMGGFISAKIISVQDIAEFSVTNGKCAISPKLDKSFKELDIEKNGVELQITTTALRSGILFDINVTIEEKKAIDEKYTSFNKYLCVLKLATGESIVLGTPDFPITVVPKAIFAKMAAGRTGPLLMLAGKQPHNYLFLN